MNSTIKKILSGLLASVSFISMVSAADEETGIERLKEPYKYIYYQNGTAHMYFGRQLKAGSHYLRGSCFRNTKETYSNDEQTMLDDIATLDRSTERFIDKDIKCAILDSDLFWSFIHAKDYIEAWRMAERNTNQQQSSVWKNATKNAALNTIELLVRRSILEEDTNSLEYLNKLFQDFERTTVIGEFQDVRRIQEQKVQATRNRLLASPALAQFTEDLRHNVVDRLLNGGI